MSFYPDIRAHASPSSLATWFNNKSLFIRSYFAGIKSPETASMRAGKQLHALAEAGLLVPKKSFDFAEMEIMLEFPLAVGESPVYIKGIPDSHAAAPVEGVVEFVDYKTGKENGWDNNMLAGDVKMKATAWLVYEKCKAAGMRPDKVRGYIEFFQTRWNDETREIEPIPGVESVLCHCDYSAADLEEFTQVVFKALQDINTEYDKWSGEAVALSEEDAAEYARLENEKKEIERKQEEVKERIAAQLDFAASRSGETPFGTFYFSERRTYEYPHNLKVNYRDMGLVLEDTEEIAAATKAAKSNWEKLNEPKSITRSLGFRPKRKKE